MPTGAKEIMRTGDEDNQPHRAGERSHSSRPGGDWPGEDGVTWGAGSHYCRKESANSNANNQ